MLPTFVVPCSRPPYKTITELVPDVNKGFIEAGLDLGSNSALGRIRVDVSIHTGGFIKEKHKRGSQALSLLRRLTVILIGCSKGKYRIRGYTC